MRTPSSGFRPDIQGLRALAVLLVVVFHAGLPLSGGFVGVDVFFVISGFVITAMLLREQQQSGRIDLWQFYRRRIFRLLPALALVISVTLMISGLLLWPFGLQQTTAGTAAGALLLQANRTIAEVSADYFADGVQLNPLLHLWSLSVEEQFYVIYPLLIVAAGRLPRPRTAIAGLIGVLTAASIGWVALVEASMLSESAAWLVGYYSPLGRAWEFTLGAAAALLPPITRRRTATVTGALAAVGLIVSAMLITEQMPFPGPVTAAPVLATVLLLVTAERAAGLRQLLSSKFAGWIGDRSYSWYLWHWPLIVFADLLWPGVALAKPLAAACALLIADLSFRHVEQPLRTAARSPGRRALAAATALIGVAAVLSALVPRIAEDYWKPRLAQYGNGQAVLQNLRADNRPCNIRADSTPQPPCIWNAAAPGAPVYLVGDSNADQFRFAVLQAALDTNRPYRQSMLHSCSFFDERVFAPGTTRPPRCLDYYLATMAWLADAQPGTVIISMTDSRWRAQADGTLFAGARARVEALERALRATILELQRSGHTVVLVKTIPQIPLETGWSYSRCIIPSLLDGSCNYIFAVESVLPRHQPGHTVYDRLAAELGVLTVDVSPEVCPNGTCSVVRDGQRVYRDRTHLSRAYAETLAPLFVDVLN